MNWITLTLLSSVVTAGNSILDKWMADKERPHPWVSATSFALVGLPIAGIGVFALPSVTLWRVLPAVLSGMLFMLAAWLYYTTIVNEQISRLAPLLRLGIVFDWALAVLFLGDHLSARQTWACAALLGSGLLLNLKSEGGQRVTLNRGAAQVLLIAALLSVHSILTAGVYRSVSLWHGIVWEKVGLLAGLLVGNGWFLARAPRLHRQTERHVWGVLLTEQTIRFVSGLAPAWAVAGGVPLILPALLGSARYIVIWLLAVMLLKEPVNRQEAVFKGIGIVGIALGALWAV